MGTHGACGYTQDGDSADGRLTIAVFVDEILSVIEKWFLPKGKGVLIDVGCGNGRLNAVLREYFKEVLFIDKYFKVINEKYVYDNCKFHKADLLELEYDGKADCILFFTSFYLMKPKYEETMKRCYELLNWNGVVVISDDAKRKDGKLSDSDYDLGKLAKDFNFTIEHEFVQKNGYSRTTVLRKGET